MGGGFEGYGKRVASSYGQFAIENSFSALGSGLLKYEPRYDLCRCTGFWPRARHALVRNFLTYNRTESERRPEIPVYAAAFGAGMLAHNWRPEDRSVWSAGADGMLSQAAFGSVSNVVGEFGVEIERMLRRKKK